MNHTVRIVRRLKRTLAVLLNYLLSYIRHCHGPGQMHYGYRLSVYLCVPRQRLQISSLNLKVRTA